MTVTPVVGAAPNRVPRKRRNSGQRWTRLLHSWLSMISLLLVLFFALTGLTLNHQDWTFGQQPLVVSASGELPAGSILDGQPDFLTISEYLRSSQGASGEITDYGAEAGTGRISYAGPGVTSSASFELATGEFTIETTRYGLIAVANDLHKGRHVSGLWTATIDAAAILLALVALTGLILQLLIQKRRGTALVLLAIGTVAGAALLYFG
ncbi:MAG TPA: PepSY-associated TM helix domain-containing protein [Propionicimonas sp.]|nr:PepSY-associated TM helix domain-containing protein [Propionicimonas sp.]